MANQSRLRGGPFVPACRLTKAWYGDRLGFVTNFLRELLCRLGWHHYRSATPQVYEAHYAYGRGQALMYVYIDTCSHCGFSQQRTKKVG